MSSIFSDHNNFIYGIMLCFGRVPSWYSFFLPSSPLFCHRLVTATSSWSHYMCHISNGCNIIIFLFCRLYYFLCTRFNVLWLRSKYSLMYIYNLHYKSVHCTHLYIYLLMLVAVVGVFSSIPYKAFIVKTYYYFIMLP